MEIICTKEPSAASSIFWYSLVLFVCFPYQNSFGVHKIPISSVLWFSFSTFLMFSSDVFLYKIEKMNVSNGRDFSRCKKVEGLDHDGDQAWELFNKRTWI